MQSGGKRSLEKMIWLAAYAAILFCISLKNARFKPGEAEYYICGRNVSTCGVSFSIMASCVGGSATIGMTGLAWHAGWPAFWWLGSGACGLVILALFLARKTRESGALTMPEIVSQHMGEQCSTAVSVIILMAWLAILAAQISAMSLIIASITNWPQVVSASIGTMFLLLYTLLGGQPAVVKSDAWQLGVLILAIGLALLFALSSDAGLGELRAASIEVTNEEFPFSKLRYFLCVLGGSYVVCPMLFGRLLSARNSACARRGALLAAAGLALAACLITSLGISCRDLVPADTRPEDVLARFANLHTPPWCALLITLGLFSAIISSADSCLMTAASVAARDLSGKKGVTWCRAWMAILAIGGCLLAIQGHGILNLLLMANDIYVCGVVCPVFVVMAVGRERKPMRLAMLAAISAGGILGFIAAFTGIEDVALAGAAASLFISLAAVYYPKLRVWAD